MKIEKKVSIIIPTYNVESYVHRAIESSLSQSYPKIELIIIDDGSTDDTWKIIIDYCKKNLNIRATRQSNKGVSFARNKGLELASGDYILFLDSDDWIEENTVERLLELSELYQDSLVCVDRYFAFFDAQNNINRERQNVNEESHFVIGDDTLKCFVNYKFNLQSSCYKIFKSEIIKKYNICFDTNLYHGEDGYFVFEYLIKVKSIFYTNDALWNILERKGSATNSSFNKKWLTAITAVDKMINYPSLPFDLRKEFYKYLVERTLMVKNSLIHSNSIDKESLRFINNKLRENKDNYLKSQISFKKKLYYLMMLYLPCNILKNIF